MINAIGNFIGGTGVGGTNYSSELNSVIALAGSEQIGIPPAMVLSVYDNSLIKPLKASSTLDWTKFSSLHVYGFGSLEFGTINLKNASTYRHILGKTTYPKAPVYRTVQDASSAFGIKSTTGAYIQTAFSTNEFANIKDNLTIIAEAAESSTDFSSTEILVGGGTVALRPLLNGTAGSRTRYAVGSAFSNTNHQGLYVSTYNGTANVIYKNGTKGANQTVTTTAPTIDVDIHLLSSNGSGVDGGNTPGSYYGKYARMVGFYNGQWTDAMELEFRTIYNNFLSAAKTAQLAYQVAPIYYLVIDMGQSNSLGLAEAGRLFLTSYSDLTPPSCYSYYKPVIDSSDNGNWDLTVLGSNNNNSPSYTTVGGEVSLAPLLRTRSTGRKCFYLKVALGGKNLWSDWNPSTVGGLYSIATATYTLALQRMQAMIEPDAVIKPVLCWHQGEQDAADGRSQAQYQSDLANFWTTFRAYDASRLATAPLFMTKVKPNTGFYAGINNAIVAYAGSVSNAYVIDLSDQPTKAELTTLQKGGVTPSTGVDDGHESYLAQIAKGERIYAQLVTLGY